MITRHELWEIDYAIWKRSETGPPPTKPPGYDLWKQGDNPLLLDIPLSTRTPRPELQEEESPVASTQDHPELF